MRKTQCGQLRIIGGRWRGRKLDFPQSENLRPTPDRVRETLFNWLQADIVGSRCLDLFAGSGALGFEAASRGADDVFMVEQDRAAIAMLNENKQMLEAQQIEVCQKDACEYLSHTDRVFDLVFIDPPYQSDLVGQCCGLLESGHCLSNHAKIYIESGKQEHSPGHLDGLPENWHCLKSKQAGQVKYELYMRQE